MKRPQFSLQALHVSLFAFIVLLVVLQDRMRVEDCRFQVMQINSKIERLGHEVSILKVKAESPRTNGQVLLDQIHVLQGQVGDLLMEGGYDGPIPVGVVGIGESFDAMEAKGP